MSSPSVDAPPSPLPPPPPPPRARGRRHWWWTGAAAAALAAVAAWHSHRAEANLPASPPSPPPAVAVARTTRQDLRREITVPAEFHPYAQVDVHARIAGFLDQLAVDIGDEVKSGQRLARLEVPELRDEQARAAATLRRAEAESRQTHLVFSRLQAVEHEHPNLVAHQDLDVAEAKDLAATAAVAAARAELGKFDTLLRYTEVTAPFDGIVTRRYLDPGALVQAGTASATQSLPLVRIADQRRLRLEFPVSVAYVQDLRVGLPVEVRVDSLGGRTFTGTVSRCAHAIDEATRTMPTEVEVSNPDLQLVPGMYAQVILRLGQATQCLAIPPEALPADHQGHVLFVSPQGTVEERTIRLGLETPTFCEVLDGLHEGDAVVIGNPSQIRPGQTVHPRFVGSPTSR